jgi:hypothetical protein
VKRTLKNEIKHPKTEAQIGTGVVWRRRWQRRVYRRPPQQQNFARRPRIHRKTPTSPGKTSRDPHTLGQGETSLARVGHTLSMKDRHGCGWRLLDRKKPTTTVVLEESAEVNRSDIKERNSNKENQVRDFAEKTH